MDCRWRAHEFSEHFLFHCAGQGEKFHQGGGETSYDPAGSISQYGFLGKGMGHALFLRHVPLELTNGGRVFYEYALRLADEEGELRRALSDVADNQRGTLRIGTGFMREREIMPALCAEFRKLYPKVSFTLVESSNTDLEKMVREGDLDLAVARFGKTVEGIVTRPFYEEHIAFLVSKELLFSRGFSEDDIESLAHSHLESMESLRSVPFVVTSRDNVAGEAAAGYLDRASFKPEIAASSDNMGTLIDLSMRSVGALFCPANMIHWTTEAASRDMVCIDLWETKYTISFGWKRKSPAWSIREAFMEYAVHSIRS